MTRKLRSISDIDLVCDLMDSPAIKNAPWLDNKNTVKKVILETGTGLFCPRDSSLCHIQIENITGFSKYKNEMFSEVCASNTVIIGNCDTCIGRVVEKILTTMKLDEVALVRCKLKIEEIREDIARDFSPITIEEDLVFCDFVMQLMSFEEQLDIYLIDDKQKLDKAIQHKERGVMLYHNGLIRSAFYRFSKAIKWLLFMCNSEHPDLKHLYVDCLRRSYLNIAACQMESGYSEYAIKNCTKAINLDPSSLKAYYRRGLALMRIQEYEKATNDFKHILTIEPDNSAAREQIRKCKEKSDEVDNFLKTQLRRLFSK